MQVIRGVRFDYARDVHGNLVTVCDIVSLGSRRSAGELYVRACFALEEHMMLDGLSTAESRCRRCARTPQPRTPSAKVS